MAININTVKVALQYLSNKDQSTGYWQAARFNSAALMAQMQEYNTQRPFFEKGMVSSDSLGILKSTTLVTIDRTTGKFDKPADYMWFSTLRAISYGMNEDGQTVQQTTGVDLLSDAEFAERRSDPFEPPSTEYPILKEQATTFEMYPKDVFKAELDYLVKPADPVWGYTVSGNTQVYDSATSVNFTLPPHLFNAIVLRMCVLLGITVRQADLVNISSQIIPQDSPK
jgi:hypothetical protein